MEQNLVSGNLEGTLVDSINFMCQVAKSQNTQIQNIKIQTTSQMKDVNVMIQDIHSFIESEKLVEKCDKYLDECITKREAEKQAGMEAQRKAMQDKINAQKNLSKVDGEKDETGPEAEQDTKEEPDADETV